MSIINADNEIDRIDPNLKNINQFLADRGLDLLWEKSTPCPCTTREGRQSIKCPLCDNKGFLYFDPIKIRGMMTSLASRKAFDGIVAVQREEPPVSQASTMTTFLPDLLA